MSLGAGADAGIDINRMVDPPSQTIEPSVSFSVTYSQCRYVEAVVFVFEGETQTIDCNALPPTDLSPPVEGAQGLRIAQAGETLGSTKATFTGPGTPGTYDGIAYLTDRSDLEPVGLQGFRGPVTAGAALIGNRVAQVTECTQAQSGCVPFEVIVEQPTTTTTTTTTTLAPTTTTTVAPTTPPMRR